MSALLDGNGLSLLGGLVFALSVPIVTSPVYFAVAWLTRNR